jgi:cation diffusion facilitator family transporter
LAVSSIQTGKRVALISILISALLAVGKIVIGWLAGSTSVVADGVESAGDVIASGFVALGFILAARPADENHPYGYGRYETVTGLLVGVILFVGGIGICYRSLQHVGAVHAPPAAYGFIPLLISLIAKAVLSSVKFRVGRRIHSTAIIADAWNDFVDIVSAGAAMTALGLTLWDPGRFLAADHYGGFAVGLIVMFTGVRVAKDTSARLTDAMPDPNLLNQIRQVALDVPGTAGVEKLFARNTGLQYHVDLHLEVDPEMTVRQAHEIANDVRFAIRRQLKLVADVLVHVEPAPSLPASQTKQWGVDPPDVDRAGRKYDRLLP